MKQLDDESMLRELGAALSLDVTPSQQEIDDLRELVVSSDTYAVVVPISTPRRRSRLSRVATVAATVVLVAVGIAALAGTSMPGSMRDPARAVGFPVQSQEMVEARSALAQLRVALAGGNGVQVAAAADLLRARLRAVSADEALQLEPEAADLLREAEARLTPPAPVAADTADTTPTGSDVAPAPVAPPTTTATPVPSVTSGSENESAEDESASKSERDTGAED